MKKFLIDDKEMNAINQMEAALELMDMTMGYLRLEINEPREGEVMNHIRSACNEIRIGMRIFVAENLIDYDKWIKANEET